MEKRLQISKISYNSDFYPAEVGRTAMKHKACYSSVMEEIKPGSYVGS